MSLVKVAENGQITLPAEAREALRVKGGDLLEAAVVEGGVMLRPAGTADRSKAWDELMAIVDRPKWIGPGPEPSDDELMEMVVEEIHQMRHGRDQGGPR
jgi:AbrB family looped-hinge helix DNA binding protein